MHLLEDFFSEVFLWTIKQKYGKLLPWRFSIFSETGIVLEIIGNLEILWKLINSEKITSMKILWNSTYFNCFFYKKLFSISKRSIEIYVFKEVSGFFKLMIYFIQQANLMRKFATKFWKRTVLETHSFFRVSGDSPHQEIRWNFGVLCNVCSKVIAF